MNSQRQIIAIAGCTLAMRFVAADAHVPTATRTEPEACSLLSPADASAALEVKALPGKRITDSDPKGCIWWDPGALGHEPSQRARSPKRRISTLRARWNSAHFGTSRISELRAVWNFA